MTDNPATAEIWELIRETRVDMKEFRADMDTFRANMDTFRANMDTFRADMEKRHAKFHAGMEEFRADMEKRHAKFHAGMEELRASQKETDRHLEELRASQKETDRQLKELRASQKETDRQLKETNDQLSKTDRRFNSQWGRLVESLVAGSLSELLRDRGIEVRQTLQNSEASFVKDGGGVQQKEFDVVVVNGSEVVAVEIKTLLTPDKVKYFLSAMEDFKRYFPDFRDKTVYGAVAYLRCESKADVYAERRGLYVVRATGDSASIVNAENFRPREFPSQQAAS